MGGDTFDSGRGHKIALEPLLEDVYLSLVKQRQEIVYFDRYLGKPMIEKIYGEGPLRWAYETGPGRFVLEALIRKPWFSALYGKWADCSCSRSEIPRFLERFDLDTAEFAKPPDSYATFNEFFSRRLTPEARPVDPAGDSVIFPADGRHLFLPDLSRVDRIYAKGQSLPLGELLGDSRLADRFRDGAALLSRLCPTDYHRFHFPLSGTPGAALPIAGLLYSVSPIALRRKIRYASGNKRQLSQITGSPVGDYLFLEIGATNVGTIVLTSSAGSPAQKGDEKGYFRFGGSMVMTLFPKDTVIAEPDLAEHSANGIELYARMGDRMGTVSPP